MIISLSEMKIFSNLTSKNRSNLSEKNSPKLKVETKFPSVIQK